MIRLLTSWAPAVLWAGILFFLSGQSHLSGPSFLHLNDKAAHFVAYLVLGGCLAWGGARWSRGLSGPRTHAALLVFGALFAATDEWHQSFVPLREPSMGDFGADVAGIVVGYVVVGWLLGKRMRPQTKLGPIRSPSSDHSSTTFEKPAQ